MMNKAKATQIAKLWNENFANTTNVTRTKAVVASSRLRGKTYYDVDIEPTDCNTGDAFYAALEAADVARAFKVSFLVDVTDNKAVGRFF